MLDFLLLFKYNNYMRKNNNNEKLGFKNNYTLTDGLKVFFYAILMSLVVSLGVTILFTVLALFAGMSFNEFYYSRFGTYLLVIAMSVSYLILYFVYNKSSKTQNFATLKLKTKFNPIVLISSVVFAVLCVFLFEPITSLILEGLEHIGFHVVGDLTYKMDTWWRVVLGIIAYALLPAFAEEIIFRGVVQNAYAGRCTAFCTIFMSTASFVVMHGSLQQFVYQIVLGVVLSVLAYYTGSLLYSIIFHFVNNLTVVVISLVGTPKYMEEGFFYLGTAWGVILPIVFMFVGVGLIVLLIWYLRIHYKKQVDPDITIEGDNIIIDQQDSRIGLKGFEKKIFLNEKLYFWLGWISAIVIWVINTLEYFY